MSGIRETIARERRERRVLHVLAALFVLSLALNVLLFRALVRGVVVVHEIPEEIVR